MGQTEKRFLIASLLLAVRGFVAQDERKKARRQVQEWLKRLKY